MPGATGRGAAGDSVLREEQRVVGTASVRLIIAGPVGAGLLVDQGAAVIAAMRLIISVRSSGLVPKFSRACPTPSCP